MLSLRRVVLSICVFLFASLEAKAYEPMPLGTVSVTQSDYLCNKTYRCWDLTVACPGVQNHVTATVYVKQPVGEDHGTITFHSGSKGTSLWDGSNLDAQNAVTSLNNAGYRIAQVRFGSDWSQGSNLEEGAARLACRPATVMRWVYDNIHVGSDSKAFCSTGNSGGAVQVSYAVTRYGLDSVIDVLVPSSGPDFARMDEGCLDTQSDLLLISQFNVVDRTYGKNGRTAPCSAHDVAYTDRFIDDSIVLGDWSFNYPSMYVHQLLGEQDTGTAAIAQGNAFHDTLIVAGSPMAYLEMVPNAGHSLNQTANGANRIKDILIDQCHIH